MTQILHIGICAYNRRESLAEAFMNAASLYHEVRPENVTEGLKNLPWRPDILFLQVQSSNYPRSLKSVLQHWKNKGTKVVNWSGDIRKTTEPWVFDLAPHVSVTCFSNDRDIENVRKAGFRSEFLQIGIDPKIFTPEGFAEPKTGEIVFLANDARHFPNGKLRLEMVKELKKTYGDRFKVYGNGWEGLADGECNVKNPLHEVNMWHKKEAAIYRGCKIAISMSNFTESRYTSDRLFRAMGCGAFTLVHSFPRMEEIIKGFCFFSTIDELKAHIEYVSKTRGSFARENCDYIHNNYTFDHMVKRIIEL